MNEPPAPPRPPLSCGTDAAPPAAAPSSAAPLSRPAPAPRFEGMWRDDMRGQVQASLAWLWHGYLASAKMTLLTSQTKSGKTTLMSVLLAKLGAGGDLAGLPLAPGKVAVLAEEDQDTWHERPDRLGIGANVCWFCRPFPGKPTLKAWRALLKHLAALHARHGLSLVVIDPLANFLPPGCENSADGMLAFLGTLRLLTALRLAVLLLHHPAKLEAGVGVAARGTGALPALADIVLEMRYHSRPAEDNCRRRLLAFSRFGQTPRQLVIELNDAGTNYLAHGDFQKEEFAAQWGQLGLVLEAATRKLTPAQIVRRWPPQTELPSHTTLWRWLDHAATRGLLLREGTGRRKHPHRYWLPGQDEKWKEPAWVLELERLNARLGNDSGNDECRMTTDQRSPNAETPNPHGKA